MNAVVRCLALLAALELVAGCSSLQIEVDVYKGALGNQPDVQTRQYAGLAIAARPLLERLTLEELQLNEPSVKANDVGEKCKRVDGYQRAEVLCFIRDHYLRRDARSTEPGKQMTETFGSYGLEMLYGELGRAIEADDQARINQTRRDLDAALIEFAEHLLAAANHDAIWPDATPAYKTASKKDLDHISDQRMKYTSVLQTLGNSLMVHANDLSRQRERREQLKQRAGPERDAIREAFTRTPMQAYASMLRTVETLSSQSAPDAPATTQALDPQRERFRTAQLAQPLLTRLQAPVLKKAQEKKIESETELLDLVRQELAAQPGSSKASADAALELLKTYRPLQNSRCSPRDAGCTDDDQLAVIDSLIASLRARRLNALAQGNSDEAASLLKAINGAYEQRTAMIYLRPASDYLRSVYSASAYQQANEPVYRNMLTDWWKYGKPDVWPFKNDKRGANSELEKLFWQNINKISLSGSGSANYVLAKDDVGNWYVKAYGSDPEPIIKAATSLALYNTGARINTNLLRQLDQRRQIDELRKDNSQEAASRRAELERQVDKSPADADPGPLLRVREQYARQYIIGSEQNAVGVESSMQTLAKNVGIQLGATDSDCANGLRANLSANKTEAGLDESRAKLTAVIEKHRSAQTSPRDDKGNRARDETLVELEAGIRSALVAMHRYGLAVEATARKATVTICDGSDARAKAADASRSFVQNELQRLAGDRKKVIAAYQDALEHLTEVASTP